MFDEAQRLGDTERKIALETRLGRPIDNYVEVDPPPSHSYDKYRLVVDRYGKNWLERKPSTGIYNCAGHVWASRRTTILDAAEWKLILDDDGYRPLRDGERPWPGDIAVYIDRDEDDEILHVGRVYTLGRGLTDASSPIPWVMSKWDSTSGESLHQAPDVPYRIEFNFGVRYYTDRPEQAGASR
jgi:hypothetical protein